MKASIFTRDGKLAGMLVSVLCSRGIETGPQYVHSGYSLDGIAGENRRGGVTLLSWSLSTSSWMRRMRPALSGNLPQR